VYEFCRHRSLQRGYEAERARLLEILDRLATDHTRGNPDGRLGRIFAWYGASARSLLAVNIDSRRHFPLDTFLCDESGLMSDSDRTVRMRIFFTEVPAPMVETLGGHRYAFGGESINDGHVFFIRSLKHLVDAIWAGTAAEWCCPFHTGCPLPMRDDTACVRQPWRRGELQPTCPYGAAARLLHLHQRAFVSDH
jgi:hypothetical protein